MTFARPSRSSSGVPSLHELLFQGRGFMVIFNRLNHMIQQDITYGVAWFLLGYHDTIRAWMTTEWVINASPTHLGFLQRPSRILRPFPVSSTPSTESSTSSTRWWHQDPALWVQGPCHLDIRCFNEQTHSVRCPRHCKVQTHSVRGQGTASGTWLDQWHPVGPLQVHVGINDNFINIMWDYMQYMWASFEPSS